MEALNSFIRVGKILEINEMMEKFMGDDWSRDSQYAINNHGAYDESWDKLISVFNKASDCYLKLINSDDGKIMFLPIIRRASFNLYTSIKIDSKRQLDKERAFFRLGEFLKLYNEYKSKNYVK